MPSRNTRPLAVSLIGAGRVGRALTAILNKRGHRIVSIVTRNPARARNFARFVHCSTVSGSLSDLSPQTELLILALPDEALSGATLELARTGNLRPAHLTAFHVSGATDSDVLSPLATHGVRTFSLHPIQTFPSGTPLKTQIRMMTGIWYGFEGNVAARPFARSLVRDLGGQLVSIPKEKKILYHVACVFAANYSVALLGAIEGLAKQLKFDGIKPLRPLVQTAVQEALNRGAVDALTGPVARGDAGVVKRHIAHLKQEQNELTQLYEALGRIALRLIVQQGTLTRDQVRALESVLSRKS